MININQKIPDISFDIYWKGNFKSVKLHDYLGKWLILLFYPADFSFVCPTELKEAADLYQDFAKLGAEVVSVSTDTKYVHKAWHDSSPMIKTIEYPMAADPTGKLSKGLGTYIEDEGLSLRGSFIIDPEGKLIAMDIHSNDIGRSMAEVKRKLEAAIYVRGHEGEVCPASWKPGDKTLKPGPELVGKI